MAERVHIGSDAFIPDHLEPRVLAMQARLQSVGSARPTRAGEPLPDWIVSFEGARCAVMLEDLFDGFAHMPGGRQLHEISWARATVEIPLDEPEVSTHSFGMITRLTVLSHEHVIRAALRPTKVGALVLALEPMAPGCWHKQHPTLEDLEHTVRRARSAATPPEGPTFVLVSEVVGEDDDDDANQYARGSVDELADKAVEMEAEGTDLTFARWCTGLKVPVGIDLESWLWDTFNEDQPSGATPEAIEAVQKQLDALVGGCWAVEPLRSARLPRAVVQHALRKARARLAAKEGSAR